MHTELFVYVGARLGPRVKWSTSLFPILLNVCLSKRKMLNFESVLLVFVTLTLILENVFR